MRYESASITTQQPNDHHNTAAFDCNDKDVRLISEWIIRSQPSDDEATMHKEFIDVGPTTGDNSVFSSRLERRDRLWRKLGSVMQYLVGCPR